MTVDAQTLAAYDQNPEEYCKTWLAQPAPEEIYRTVRKYFRPGGATADIGSGSGRDTDWLNRNGYPCTGYELSAGLRQQAQKLFPSCKFLSATLPGLDEIPSERFDNVLCETVLQHLPQSAHAAAVENLLRILKPGGILRLSWRGGKPGLVDGRDEGGRLYTPVSIRLYDGLAAERMEEGIATGASGAEIHHVILRKTI